MRGGGGTGRHWLHGEGRGRHLFFTQKRHHFLVQNGVFWCFLGSKDFSARFAYKKILLPQVKVVVADLRRKTEGTSEADTATEEGRGRHTLQICHITGTCIVSTLHSLYFFMGNQEAVIASTEEGKDVEHVQMLQRKFDELQAELLAQKDRIKDVNDTADRMV